MAGDKTIRVLSADAQNIADVMHIMQAAFHPSYGEAWTTNQVAGMLCLSGTWLFLAYVEDQPGGFAMVRSGGGDAELLLIATHPKVQGIGIGKKLLQSIVTKCYIEAVERLFLEVRACNPAIQLYTEFGFKKIGERRDYYRGHDGKLYDAHSYSLLIKNTS